MNDHYLPGIGGIDLKKRLQSLWLADVSLYQFHSCQRGGGMGVVGQNKSADFLPCVPQLGSNGMAQMPIGSGKQI